MILFSDFDNTLFYEDDASIFQSNLAALRRWKQANNQFGLATNRILPSLERDCPEVLELTDYLILGNGAFCLDSTGEVLLDFGIPHEVAKKYTETVLRENRSAIREIIYYDALSACATPPKSTAKIRIIVGDEGTAQGIYARTMTEFGSDMIPHHIYHFGESWTVDCFSSRADKTTAISELIKLIALDGEIITVGDANNDIGMLARYDGYAVSNAEPDVLKTISANHIVPSVASLIDGLLVLG